MPVGPTILCPVNATRSAPSAATSTGSCGTAWEASTHQHRADRVGQRRRSREIGLTVPSTLDTYATETILVRSLIRPVGRGASRSSRPSSVTSNQRSVAPVRSRQQLPRHDVGVVLHHRDDDLVAGPQAGAEGVGAQVQRLGGVLGEDDLLGAGRADELGERGPRALERLGRLGAQQVHGPGDVGVVVQVMIFDRLDHDARLLRGVRAVQVDQRPVRRRPLQDREVGADVLDVERDRLVGGLDVGDLGHRDGGRVLR